MGIDEGDGDIPTDKFIRKLLSEGWTPTRIIKEKGIPSSTVYLHYKKEQDEVADRMFNFMKEEYLWQYFQNSDRLNYTIQQANEAIERIKKNRDIQLTEVNGLILQYTGNNATANALASLLSTKSNIYNNAENQIKAYLAQRDQSAQKLAEVLNKGPAVHATKQALSKVDDSVKFEESNPEAFDMEKLKGNKEDSPNTSE